MTENAHGELEADKAAQICGDRDHFGRRWSILGCHTQLHIDEARKSLAVIVSEIYEIFGRRENSMGIRRIISIII